MVKDTMHIPTSKIIIEIFHFVIYKIFECVAYITT